jgi:hypothetical protein
MQLPIMDIQPPLAGGAAADLVPNRYYAWRLPNRTCINGSRPPSSCGMPLPPARTGKNWLEHPVVVLPFCGRNGRPCRLTNRVFFTSISKRGIKIIHQQFCKSITPFVGFAVFDTYCATSSRNGALSCEHNLPSKNAAPNYKCYRYMFWCPLPRRPCQLAAAVSDSLVARLHCDDSPRAR